MMIIQYPAKITYSKSDKSYLVEFQDLPGCLTEGGTVEEAQANAREALSGYLESIDMRKIDIPRPSRNKGKDVYYITPEPSVAFAIWMKLARIERGLSQKQAAERLGINFQAYQKFENPKKANPTLKTIDRIERAFGVRLIAVS